MDQQEHEPRRASSPLAAFAMRHFVWWACLWPVGWFAAILLIRSRSPQMLNEFASFLGFGVLLLSGAAFPIMLVLARQDDGEEAAREAGTRTEHRPPRVLLWIVCGVTAAFAFSVATWLLHGAPRHVPTDPGDFDYTHVRSIRGE